MWTDRGIRSSVAFIFLALLLTACGGAGESPTSPAGANQGVVLRGSVMGMGALSHGLAGSLSRSAPVITVTVAENTAFTTTVGADGSFTLRGLPPGGFTLVFTSGGAEIGRLKFSEVKPNQEITLTVTVTSGSVVLLEESRNGIGHGDIEIEGTVDSVIVLDPAGESRFLINGRTVVARPGQTAIREGNRSRSVSDVTARRQVHVKGVWLTHEGGVQPVLAREIKLQGGAEPSPTPAPPATGKCVAGAKTEVEGVIEAKGASSITVRQQGKGDFLCEVSGGTRIRKGNTAYTFVQLQPGWRVHVSGAGLGLSGSLCRVQADEIKVQQAN